MALIDPLKSIASLEGSKNLLEFIKCSGETLAGLGIPLAIVGAPGLPLAIGVVGVMSAAASIAVLMKQGKEGSELKENVERLHRLIEAQAAREEDAAELTRNTFAAAAHLIARVERGEAPDSQLDAFAKTEAAGIVALYRAMRRRDEGTGVVAANSLRIERLLGEALKPGIVPDNAGAEELAESFASCPQEILTALGGLLGSMQAELAEIGNYQRQHFGVVENSLNQLHEKLDHFGANKKEVAVPPQPSDYPGFAAKGTLLGNCFEGRAEQLGQLREALERNLTSDHSVPQGPIVVVGTGGIGKSSLVYTFVTGIWGGETGAKYFTDGFYYFECRNDRDEQDGKPLDSKDLRTRLANDFLDHFGAGLDRTKLFDASGEPHPNVWNMMNKPHRLVLIDSAELLPDDLDLGGFLSATTLLYCSRPNDERRGALVNPAAMIPVREMNGAEALAAFKKYAEIPVENTAFDEKLKELINPLGGNPLALSAYGRLLASKAPRPGEVATDTLGDLIRQVRDGNFIGLEHNTRKIDFFRMYDRQFTLFSEEAQALLPLFALPLFGPVPEALVLRMCFDGETKAPLIAQLGREEDVRRALNRLEQLGLLSREVKKTGVLYRVTHAIYYAWLQKNVLKLRRLPYHENSLRRFLRRLPYRLRFAFRHEEVAGNHNALAARYIDLATDYLEKRATSTKGGWVPPQTLLPLAERCRQLGHASGARGYGRALLELATVQMQCRDFVSEIEIAPSAAREMWKSGQVHQLGATFHRIGVLHAQRLEWEATESAYRRALRWYKRARRSCGLNRLGSTYHQIGNLHAEQRHWAEALKAYNKAIEWNTKTRPEDVGGTYHQIGNLLAKQRHWKKAQKAYDKAIEWKTKTGQEQALGSTYHQIGMLHAEQRHWEAALEAYNKAIEWNTKTRLENVGGTYHQVGILHGEQRHWEAALEAYQTALRWITDTEQFHERWRTYASLMVMYAEKFRDPATQEADDGEKAAAHALQALDDCGHYAGHEMVGCLEKAYWTLRQFPENRSGKLGELRSRLEEFFRQNRGLRELLDWQIYKMDRQKAADSGKPKD